MKRKLFILIFCNLCVSVMGQEIRFGVGSGLGFYQLNDLSKFQTHMNEMYYPMELKMVEQFPPYLNFSGMIETKICPRFDAGITAGFYSTGARNHRKDYSGEYKFDMLLKGYKVALSSKFRLIEFNKSYIYTELQFGMMFSRLFASEMLVDKINNYYSEYKYKANSFFIEPTIGYNYRIFKNLALNFSAGYMIDQSKGLVQCGGEGSLVEWLWGEPVKVNWSGLRLSLSVFYNFSPSGKQTKVE